jgi:hypothetical protein
VATTEITLNLEKLQESAPIVKITWIDAQADAGWEKPKVDLAKCVTVGFLVAEDDEGICVAGTVSDNMCNNVISIPKRWIIQEELEEKHETTKRQSKGKKPAKVGQRRTAQKTSATRTRRY